MERSSPVYDNKKGCCTSIKKVAVYQVCYLNPFMTEADII